MSNLTLEQYNPKVVAKALSSFPFVTIDGVSNVRTLGSYPVGYREPNGGCLATRPNFMFRGAEVSGITERGVQQLQNLNIKKVFDLRSEVEMHRNGAYMPAIKNVEVVWTPVFKSEDFSDTAMASKFEMYSSDNIEAFMQQYTEILDNAGPAYAAILAHIRDRPQEGCLFHCTAGKDRTGLIAAILFKLAGVHDEYIVEDYHLTEIGRAPDRDKVMQRLSRHQFFIKNPQRASNMLRARREVMAAFLNLLQQKYGGAEAYVKRYCQMTDEDIRVIRQNMLISSPRL